MSEAHGNGAHAGARAGAGSGAPRSRRAMREAERAAEREAALTGQQPVLTRRELRRLRQEAEALQAAIEAGEITLEQAKALQDPLADAPAVDVPPLRATGSHASLPAQLADDLTPPSGTARAARVQAPATQGTGAVASQPAEPLQPGVADQPTAVAPAVATPSAQVDPQVADTPERPAVSVATQQGADAAEQARREALAAVETGELAAQDLPIVSEAVPQGQASSPQRRSLRERAQAGEQPSGPSEAGGGVHATPEVSGESEQQGHVPARRPIVRIPAGAQGVRTVDSHTGELSAVQPVEEAAGRIATPRWRSLHEAGEGSPFAPVSSAAPQVAPAGPAAPREEQRGLPQSQDGESAGAAPEGAEDSAAHGTAEDAKRPRRGWSHYLLTILFLMVLVLVVATVVWFYMGGSGSSSSAPVPGSTWAPVSLL